jgi:Excreted virulence factor EspC, type VII ESX diderm
MTHPPSPDQVAVATAALRTEAKQWDEQSGAMAGLSATVAAMEFGRLEAGLFQLMVGPYNEVVHAVAARCAEASTAMTEIGGTLRSVADTYDAEDRAAEHRLRNVY